MVGALVALAVGSTAGTYLRPGSAETAGQPPVATEATAQVDFAYLGYDSWQEGLGSEPF